MSSQGWIKLHRKLKESPLYKDCNSKQRDILINLLLMVNHKSNKWIFKGEEHEVKAGQVVTSLESIANMCAKDVSVQNVRTALLKFEKHGFLTNKSTNKNRLITIVNWELYQSEEEKQQTKQQAPNKQLTTNKNVKNEKNEIYSRVITRLNGLTSKNFKYTTKKTISYIDSRLKDGFSEQDFYKVIDIKVEEWINTDMAKYLRPETLFGTKFESYLNQGSNNIDEEKSKGKVLDFKIGGE